MRYFALALLLSVTGCSSTAIRGPRQIPERSRGVYAFDILLPDPSIRDRLKGTYQVLADTVLLDVEGMRACEPVAPHPAEEDIRYVCGEVGNSFLYFAFDPRRPHAEAWAIMNVTTVGQRRECVAYDSLGRCSNWRTEYADITRTERVRLNATKVM